MITYVIGAPRTGKTTLARKLAAETGAHLVSTDDYLILPHDLQPTAIALAMLGHHDVVVEGVAAARLLPNRPDGRDHGAPRPDRVVWCRGPSECDPRYAGLSAMVTKFASAYAATAPVETRRLDALVIPPKPRPRHLLATQRTRELLKLARMISIKRPRARKIPAQRPPLAIEASFGRELANLVKSFRDDFRPLREALPGLLESARREERGDARLDAGERDEISRILAGIEERMRSRIAPEGLRGAARRAGEATARFQREQFGAQVRAAFGVDVLINDRDVAAKVDDFVAETVGTIRHLPTKLTAEVEKLVYDAFARGDTYQELAGKLETTLDVSEEKAYSIAGQQVAKLNAKVTKLRQENMGVRRYTWRTVRDEKVRPSHRAREGKVYSWDDPPSGETPGNAPGWLPCRCYAEPDFSALLDGDDEAPPASRAEEPEARDFQPVPTASPEEWAERRFSKFAEKRTAAETEAVRFYGGGGFRPMNEHLRAKVPVAPEVEQHIQALTRYIKRGAMPEDTLLYRGISGSENGRPYTRKGSVVTDLGFASTSAKPGTAQMFGSRNLLEIEVPAGAPVGWIPPTPGAPSEAEFVLPPGTKFHVLGTRTKTINGMRVTISRVRVLLK